MEKKTSKRQTTIITLSDHNKQEIRNILTEKEIMESEFDERKQGDNKYLYYNVFHFICHHT